MENTTNGAISLFTNLIGTPQYWEELPNGQIMTHYDMAYGCRAFVLCVFVVTLCGILIKFSKGSFGGKK